MKNSLLLLMAGIANAAFAWAFWHFLGEYAVTMLLLIALITTLADNARLGKNVRRFEISDFDNQQSPAPGTGAGTAERQ